MVIDTRRAVLLEHTMVSTFDSQSGEHQGIALELEGRINRTQERARILYLLNADGGAALVSELVGIAGRISPQFGAEFVQRIRERLAEMP